MHECWALSALNVIKKIVFYEKIDNWQTCRCTLDVWHLVDQLELATVRPNQIRQTESIHGRILRQAHAHEKVYNSRFRMTQRIYTLLIFFFHSFTSLLWLLLRQWSSSSCAARWLRCGYVWLFWQRRWNMDMVCALFGLSFLFVFVSKLRHACANAYDSSILSHAQLDLFFLSLYQTTIDVGRLSSSAKTHAMAIWIQQTTKTSNGPMWARVREKKNGLNRRPKKAHMFDRWLLSGIDSVERLHRIYCTDRALSQRVYVYVCVCVWASDDDNNSKSLLTCVKSFGLITEK